MNKRYVLAGNEAFVYDENADKTERANQEGLESVLEQENVVEEIQKQINSVNENISDLMIFYDPELKKRAILSFGFSGILIGFLVAFLSILALIIGSLSAIIFKDSIVVTLKNIAYIVGGGIGLGIPASLGFFLINEVDGKYTAKKLNALQSQLEYLKQREKVEVAKLEQMKAELAKQPIVKTDVTVDKELDLEQLKQFRAELEQSLDTVYDENYKKPEKSKQKVIKV